MALYTYIAGPILKIFSARQHRPALCLYAIARQWWAPWSLPSLSRLVTIFGIKCICVCLLHLVSGYPSVN